jgi:hypothetical protein
MRTYWTATAAMSASLGSSMGLRLEILFQVLVSRADVASTWVVVDLDPGGLTSKLEGRRGIHLGGRYVRPSGARLCSCLELIDLLPKIYHR